MLYDSDRHIYRAEPLARLEWLLHGFGARHTGDWIDPLRLTTLRQVHSSTVHLVDGQPGCAGEGDGLISARPGCLLAVRTADCLPVVLADQRTRHVAIVHAGWRGIVGGIVPKTISRFVSDCSCAVEDLHAAIGPGIGACCFEVGPEVAALFGALFPERQDLDRKTRLDLPEAVRRQLLAAGVPASRIYGGAPCTCCTPSLFHSYRRDREQAGRMISAVGVRP